MHSSVRSRWSDPGRTMRLYLVCLFLVLSVLSAHANRHTTTTFNITLVASELDHSNINLDPVERSCQLDPLALRSGSNGRDGKVIEWGVNGGKGSGGAAATAALAASSSKEGKGGSGGNAAAAAVAASAAGSGNGGKGGHGGGGNAAAAAVAASAASSGNGGKGGHGSGGNAAAAAAAASAATSGYGGKGGHGSGGDAAAATAAASAASSGNGGKGGHGGGGNAAAAAVAASAASSGYGGKGGHGSGGDAAAAAAAASAASSGYGGKGGHGSGGDAAAAAAAASAASKGSEKTKEKEWFNYEADKIMVEMIDKGKETEYVIKVVKADGTLLFRSSELALDRVVPCEIPSYLREDVSVEFNAHYLVRFVYTECLHGGGKGDYGGDGGKGWGDDKGGDGGKGNKQAGALAAAVLQQQRQCWQWQVARKLGLLGSNSGKTIKRGEW
ncbi:hypothetical protein EVAR_22222_1 [Eumeta japonica]|uniref:Uncharacterized protein n=1 Tax=Eumeta variegata TaxID=151549 RepID=A0A4C1UBQ1_EUMVA|nr:hypothetical protein EVAR_22222_1 [Eumeta japonica]